MRKIIFLHIVCILITFAFLGCKKTSERKENNPNDTLSFNAIVGNRSAENGFKSASTIVNAEPYHK